MPREPKRPKNPGPQEEQDSVSSNDSEFPKSTGFSPPSRFPKATGFQNSIPAPEIREMGEETGWAEWNDAVEQTDRQFAQTAPMTAPFPLDGGDRRYAKTEPSGLTAAKDDAKPAARKKKVSADEVMVEARKNNRVCPKPRRWAELFGMFSQWTSDGTDLPAPPLTGDIWNRTPALAKRMCFRDHIEWAENQGCIEKLRDYLKDLPEEDWHHMGD